MAVTYRHIKARRNQAKFEAHSGASVNLQPLIEPVFYVSEMTRKSDEAWSQQWRPASDRMPPNGGFDWPAYRRSFHGDADAFDMAIWTDDGSRLSALALGTLSATALRLLAAEGDPRDDCPLKKVRLLIILEASALFAQLTGRKQIHLVNPANDEIAEIYKDRYGFAVKKPKGGEPFCWKEI